MTTMAGWPVEETSAGRTKEYPAKSQKLHKANDGRFFRLGSSYDLRLVIKIIFLCGVCHELQVLWFPDGDLTGWAFC
jgi:hypothetical protein